MSCGLCSEKLINKNLLASVLTNRGFALYNPMIYIKRLSSIILMSIGMSFFATILFSCDNSKDKVVESIYDPEIVPTMQTHNDTMYISDSGRIKYKVMGKTMLMYDKAKEPFSLYPDKAYLEEYDTLMNVVTTLRADSVWNYSKKKLWKLRGRVNIVNVKGESFDSEELFWDEQNDLVYSNLYVIINRPNEIAIKAYSFESNSSMTDYTLKRATDVDIYVHEEDEEQSPQNEEATEK